MMLNVNGVSRAWGDRVVLDRLSFSVRRGEVYGLLGPNGAGKSTTIRIVCGLLAPDSGSVLIDGAVVDAPTTRNRVGLATQDAALYRDLTCRENLVLFARMWGLDRARAGRRAEELIERFHLEQYAAALAGTLSGGWQRRLHVAIAMVHAPDVVILDEPTAGLDMEARADLWSAIRSMRESGAAILLTTHDLREAERVCDRIGILHNGSLAAEGTMEELARAVPAVALAEIESPDEPSIVSRASEHGWLARRYNDRLTLHLPARFEIAQVINALRGIELSSVAMREITLEHVYVEVAGAREAVTLGRTSDCPAA